MSTSRFIFTRAGKAEMAINGLSSACHVRILMGAFVPSLALATVADLTNESVHADYAPVDVTVSGAFNGPLVAVDATDASFNSGNPTTLGGKYLVLCKGTAAASSGTTPVIAWCDGAVEQLTAASLSNANPAVATSAAHGLVAGNVVCIPDCDDADLIGAFYTVANETANTFELTGLDLSGNAGAISADLINISNTDEESAASDIAHAAINGLIEF